MKRTARLSAAGLLAAAGALVAVTTPADAAGRPDGVRGPVSHATGVDTRAEQDAVRAFWTPARMKQAVPRGQVRPLAKPGGAGGGKPKTTDPSLGTKWTDGRVTVGKAFFRIGSSLYVCSGNAVDDVQDNKAVTNLVVTAGHCVNDGGTEFVDNFMFIPAYDAGQPRNGSQPHGTFTASELYTTAEWAAQGSDRFDYDVGIALVGPNERGVELTTAVGSSDIDFLAGDPDNREGIDYTIDTHAFGYPQARPYDGTELIACWGTTTEDTVGGSSDYRLRCNMTGGSSGGPWLLDSDTGVDPNDPIDNSDVSDVQVSVNSFGYRGEKNAMYGPIFGGTVEALHAAAVAAASG